jgi:hypothetical protein
MKKHILKGVSILTLLVAVAFVTAVAPAKGQSVTLRANVPFEFSVGDKTLASGEYRVTRMGHDAMTIAGREDSAIRLSIAIESNKVQEQGKLVFHRYGENYFLSEVWTAGDKTGRKLLKSKQERRIEEQLARTFSKSELAQNAYEVVEIVAMVR